MICLGKACTIKSEKKSHKTINMADVMFREQENCPEWRKHRLTGKEKQK